MRTNVSRYLLGFAFALSLSQPILTNAAPTETISGTVEIVHIDGIDHKDSRYEYFLNEGGQKVPVRMEFKGEIPANLKAGSKINVHGLKKGRVFQVEQVDQQATGSTATTSTSSTTTSDAKAPAVVERKAVTLLVNMKNGVNAVGSISSVTGSLYDNASSVKGQYDASSYGQLSFNRDTDADGKADVFGPFTIDADATASCDYYDWAYKAEAAATAAGINLSKYQHKVFVLPSYSQLTQCGWGGVGNLACGDSCRAWIAYDARNTYSHELGHNLSMHHAAVDSNNDSALESEYGDSSSVMGSNYGANQFNGPNKVQMGWMAAFAGSTSNVSGVNNNISLSALELDRRSQNPGIQVLTHPRAAGGNYYVSFRQAVGSYGALSEYANRVSVHSFDGGSTKTRLIKHLAVGEQFSDANSGFTMSFVGISADGLTAELAVASTATNNTTGTCTSSAPSFSISPANQSGLPGSQFAYNLSVTNNDSSTCSASTFNISANVSKLAASLAASSLVLAPGASSSTQLVVTSGSTNTDGSYPFSSSITASNRNTVSSNGSVVLDGTAPSAPSNLTASVRKRAITLTWAASNDNLTGVANYRVVRNNVVIANTGSTTFYDRNITAGSIYTYQVYALDKVGNVSAPSNAFTTK